MRHPALTGRARRRVAPLAAVTRQARPATVADLAGLVDGQAARARSQLRARMASVLGAVRPEAGAGTGSGILPTPTLLADLADLVTVAPRCPDRILWLLTAVLTADLPDPAAIVRIRRTLLLEGAPAALDLVLAAALDSGGRGAGSWPDVEIVTGQVVVDLHDTARSAFATGIQRVARQTSRRWVRDHRPVLVGWHHDRPALRRLTGPDFVRALYADDPVPADVVVPAHAAISDRAVLVPWECTYVLPELLADPERVGSLHGMLEFSANAGAVIGFDCVPLTTGETTAAGMGGVFVGNLAAVAHADRLAAISVAAAREYQGWRRMLGGTGLTGPDVRAVPLPAEPAEPTAAALVAARERLVVGGLPLVLVVGSHEPRKNHLAVLHAAELLWRDGVEFSLVFIGGNAWRSEGFRHRLGALSAAGRPVHMLNAISDDELWAAYRLARCTVFPSLNEGFGLPVAESLALGTPAVTSGFGSMAEIAAGGGALLVDPRDAADVAGAMRALIGDDVLHAALRAAALGRARHDWDAYSAQAWDFLVDARDVAADAEPGGGRSGAS